MIQRNLKPLSLFFKEIGEQKIQISDMNGKFDLLYSPIGFENILLNELEYKNISIIAQEARIFLIEKSNIPIYFVQLHAREVQFQFFESISQASHFLKNIQRNWANLDYLFFRRAEMIKDKLPFIKSRRIQYLEKIPESKMGLWLLCNEHLLLYSASTNSPYPLGIHEFEEDKEGPPSRAYLKLWEIFTLKEHFPSPGEKVIDLGSAPGGWTWVLAKLKGKVKSVDRSLLIEKLMLDPAISFEKGDAFKVDPTSTGDLSWIFSDIICYPEKSYELIQKWLLFYPNSQFVITIKFQGETNFKVVELLEKIPNSKLVHLYHNKHELTWYKF